MTDQVFAIRRASILNGEMPAGHRLRIRDLAAQVGTSVMPVREAVRRLEEAGLAGREPHKGAVVKRMKRLYDQMMTPVQEGDAVAYLDSDEAFLATLYEASANPVLVRSIQTLWERCRSYKLVGARAVLQADNRKPLWECQARLLKAARAKDPDEAARVNDESLRPATARIHDELTAEIAGSNQPAVP